MLYHELSTRLQAFSESPALFTNSGPLTYSDLLTRSSALVHAWNDLRSRKVGVYLPDGPELLITLVALDALQAEAYLLGAEWPVAKAKALAERYQLDDVLTTGSAAEKPFRALPGNIPSPVPGRPETGEGRVVIFTSGTTGEPKGALHTWRSLSAGIKVESKFAGTRWLVTYGLTRFAGLQVFLHSFLNGGCLVVPCSNAIDDLARLIEQQEVENVSGTPTFWRKLLTALPSGTLKKLPLKQITLGGEIAGQTILNTLRAAFPEAQITHIYASTEAGVCFSVRDGKEGFPLDYLNRSNDRVAFQINDGELFIRSRRAMAGYVGHESSEEWLPSSDLVEVRGERVYFLGRKSDIINVGGSKVYPAEVEEEIKRVPGVLNVRVSGQRSSFAGQLVRAEIVAAENVGKPELKMAILKWCAETLAAYKRPRLIEFVEALPETESRKIVRQQSNEQ